MKVIFLLALLSATSAHADQYVNGYYRANGTHVEGYHRTNADSNPYNNYSTSGNVNPYTGAIGRVNPNPPVYGNSNTTNPSGYNRGY